ncbi:glutathione S-transferase T3-like [Raphanus sativus]|uniref:Glutathione S-transferase T3-like n=1 Tax=Raphanus sativus TaxID=3726 RepID=A0A6J0N4R0_RAPSA|nr:glutathione S-transferase T3-like [Raphanus sativus]
MDPRNPYTQSSYLGHLNNIHENLSYDSFPSTVNFGASEIPHFSSQQSDAPSPPEVTAAERSQRTKWTPADDEVLISAWLNTSKDPIVGNSQKGGTFWDRVGAYYSGSPHAIENGDQRNHRHCKQRWHRLNDQVNKFCAAYSAAERQLASGEYDTDVLKKAHHIFFTDQGTRFNLEHAWCLLRHEQKWADLNFNI